MIEKLNTHYSFTNPATVHDEEALTTLELVGRTTAKLNEVISDQNSLRTETENHLENQDNTIEQRMNTQETSTIPSNVTMEFTKQMNNGTFTDLIDKYAGQLLDLINNVNNRVTNLSVLGNGSTTGDAELIDIRNGANGVNYANAGESVRGQFLELFKEFNNGLVNDYTLYEGDTGLALDSVNIFRGDRLYHRKEVLTSLKFYIMAIVPIKVYIIGASGKVLDIMSFTGSAVNTWQTFTVNKLYDEDYYIGICTTKGTKYTHTFNQNVDIEYYSIGLKECSSNGVFVGSNVTFTQTVPERFYSFFVEVKTTLNGIYEYIWENKDKIVEMSAKIVTPSRAKLDGFDIPKCHPVEGEYGFIGRWYDKEIDGKIRKVANADGSSILFKVSGANTIYAGFDTLSTPTYTPYYAYSVDGSPFTRKQITDSGIQLPDDGEHVVWIVVDGMGENDPVGMGKWTGSVGVYFTGVSNGTKQALEPVNRNILFVGDSIVEGINVLGTGANADVNSATNGFAFRTARNLNSIPLLCGYGGTSTLGSASFADALNAIDYNMSGVPVNDMRPDLILIEHGYNDGSIIAIGNRTTSEFIEAYTKLIKRLRVKYAGVPIICMIPFKQSLREHIINVASNFDNCYVVETSDYGVTYSDNAHPNVAGSINAAVKLSESLIEVMGKEFFM